MSYHIEVLSLGHDSDDKIAEVGRMLNAAQTEFKFTLPTTSLKTQARRSVLRRKPTTLKVFELLENCRREARGHHPFLLAVVTDQLASPRLKNIFGSVRASEGLSVVTLFDHQQFADSHRPFLAYYFIRFALSFVCPALKSHEKPMDCFFDKKLNKDDLLISIRSGAFCTQCFKVLKNSFNEEIEVAIDKMVGVMKSMHEDSRLDLDARGLQGQVDVGIITIRQDECDAVARHLSNDRTAVGPNRSYSYARVQTQTGNELGVALTRMLDQGPGSAQATTRDMIDDLAPPWIFLVGIAGGVPDQEFTLGDVLLASRLHDFSISAEFEDKEPEFQQLGGPMHLEVDRLISRPRLAKELEHWSSEESLGMSRPKLRLPDGEPDADHFYGDEDFRHKVLGSLRKHFGTGVSSRDPIFHVGPAIAGGALVKSATLLQLWQTCARHACSVEMELGGVYLGARYGSGDQTRVLAIRGISDIVGYKREPIWTEFACRSAGAFAIALLKSGIIKKDATAK